MQPQGHVQVNVLYIFLIIPFCDLSKITHWINIHLTYQPCAQVLLNMIEYGMDAQTALDSSRFCIDPGHSGCTGEVALEEGISMETASKLRDLGHQIRWPVQGYDRSLFGRGQIIRSQTVNSRGENGNIDLRQERIWLAGSDSRADGAAVGY